MTWLIRIKNIKTGAIVRFERTNDMNHMTTTIEANKWCAANGYQLLTVESKQ